MALQFDVSTRNAMLAQIIANIGANGYINIYSGDIPVNTSAPNAADGNLLASLPLSGAFAPAPTNGVLAANPVSIENSVASGTAVYFRIYDNAQDICRVQGTVGTANADLNLNTTNIVVGGPIAITSINFIAPGA